MGLRTHQRRKYIGQPYTSEYMEARPRRKESNHNLCSAGTASPDYLKTAGGSDAGTMQQTYTYEPQTNKPLAGRLHPLRTGRTIFRGTYILFSP